MPKSPRSIARYRRAIRLLKESQMIEIGGDLFPLSPLALNTIYSELYSQLLDLYPAAEEPTFDDPTTRRK